MPQFIDDTQRQASPRKGRHKADGARQYTYPTGLDDIDWDQTTGEQFETKLTRKTVLIPGTLGESNTEHLKYGQEFEYKSET